MIMGLWIFITGLMMLPALAADTLSIPLGEKAIVRVYYPDAATGNKILISFEPYLQETNFEDGYHIMEVSQKEVDLLIAAQLRVELDIEWSVENLRATAKAVSDTDEGIPGYPCYRTVEETFATAQQIVNDYPNLAAWMDVGNSWEKESGSAGYDMLVLRLTNSLIPGPKPKLFLTGAMHAREYATAELVTRFAESLVDNYGINADATWILDHHEVHLMLQTNPDGRKQAEAGLSWRKNTNGTYCLSDWDSRGADLNRNFEFEWNCCGGSSDDECYATYHGLYPASEPEIQAVEQYLDSIFPDQREDDPSSPAPLDATGIYIDVHSYGRLVLWPWGSTSDLPPNSDQLQTLGRKFAYWNDHSPEQAIGLYPTDGTSDDHAYGKLGVAAYCFELGTSFFQSCSYFEGTIVPDNMPSLLYAAKAVRTPYMTPGGPDASSISLSASQVQAGTPVTIYSTLDDTRYNNSNGTEPTQNITAAEYYVDIPPWNSGTPLAMAPSDGSFDNTVEDAQATLDTTGLNVGKHIIYVRGMDADNNWGAFSATFLLIQDEVSLPLMFVQSIDMTGLRKGSNRIATAAVTVLDNTGNPVSGATVSGTWSGVYSGTVSGVTDVNGMVSFVTGKVKLANAAFTFTIDNIVKTAYLYDSTLNNETSDTIVIP